MTKIFFGIALIYLVFCSVAVSGKDRHDEEGDRDVEVESEVS